SAEPCRSRRAPAPSAALLLTGPGRALPRTVAGADDAEVSPWWRWVEEEATGGRGGQRRPPVRGCAAAWCGRWRGPSALGELLRTLPQRGTGRGRGGDGRADGRSGRRAGALSRRSEAAAASARCRRRPGTGVRDARRWGRRAGP